MYAKLYAALHKAQTSTLKAKQACRSIKHMRRRFFKRAKASNMQAGKFKPTFNHINQDVDSFPTTKPFKGSLATPKIFLAFFTKSKKTLEELVSFLLR